MDLSEKKFEVYQKWFNTFLIRSFIDLPSKYQEKFIYLVESFLKKCKKLRDEHKKTIIEKDAIIEISKIDYQNNLVTGIINSEEIRISIPKETGIEIGSKIKITLYSIDNEVWYSSKVKLITGRS